ncbi:RNA-processing protein, HAT helix containing protein [Tanacetum coccineum]
MDSHKLSMDTCMHAEQNERLRLRVVVQVLFSEHVKIINAIASSTVKETGESHDKATKAVPAIEQLSMYEIYITHVAEIYGVPETWEIYEQAISSEGLPEKDAMKICIKYAEFEKSHGKTDHKWHESEVNHGKEDTFRGMLQIKRSVSERHSQINQDGDANISFPKLKELLQDVKFRQLTWGKEQTIKQVMKEFDYDCDTKVTVDEFTDRFTKWLDETKSTSLPPCAARTLPERELPLRFLQHNATYDKVKLD